MNMGRLHDAKLLGGRDTIAGERARESIATQDPILEPSTPSRLASEPVDRLRFPLLCVDAQRIHGVLKTKCRK
jgi:hypothetical protein